MRPKQKSIKEILANAPSVFHKLLHQVEQAKWLTQQLLTYLSPEFHAHTRVATFHNGTLLIVTDSAVWATQLRYLFPSLLTQLRTEAGIHGLISMRCIIDPICFYGSKENQHEKSKNAS